MNNYPILRFLEKYGDWVAIGVALAALIAGIGAVLLGASAWWLFAGVVFGAVLFVLGRSYIELIRLMTDMLLPK